MFDKKEKFGDGRDTCKVCGSQLGDVRVMKISIKHASGCELADLRYFVPLCPTHSSDQSLVVNIGWEAGRAPIDAMRD